MCDEWTRQAMAETSAGGEHTNNRSSTLHEMGQKEPFPALGTEWAAGTAISGLRNEQKRPPSDSLLVDKSCLSPLFSPWAAAAAHVSDEGLTRLLNFPHSAGNKGKPNRFYSTRVRTQA